MREVTVTEMGACACGQHAQVLLQTVGGTTGIILPLDYAVAAYVQESERAVGDELSPFLMDRLLSSFVLKGFSLKRVVIDITLESRFIGKVFFGRHLLTEKFLCSPSEALLVMARARVPLWITDAVLRIRPSTETRALPTVRCRRQEATAQ